MERDWAEGRQSARRSRRRWAEGRQSEKVAEELDRGTPVQEGRGERERDITESRVESVRETEERKSARRSWNATELRTECGSIGEASEIYTGYVPRAEHGAAVRQYHTCGFIIYGQY